MRKERTINIVDIDYNDSRFDFDQSLNATLAIESDNHNILAESLNSSTGILYPILLYEVASNHYIIVDGFKRFLSLKKSANSKTVGALVITDNYDLLSFAKLILALKQDSILRSIGQKSRYIDLLIKLGLKRNLITEEIFPYLDLVPNQVNMNELLAISNLDTEQFEFIDQKRLSLRQIQLFIRTDASIRETLFLIKDQLSLTLSSMINFADIIHDITKRESISIDELFNDLSISAILEDDKMQAKTKQSKIKDLLIIRKNPTISKINAKIDQMVSNARLNKNIRLEWDRSLETRNVTVSITVSDLDSINQCSRELTDPKLTKLMQELFSEL